MSCSPPSFRPFGCGLVAHRGQRRPAIPCGARVCGLGASCLTSRVPLDFATRKPKSPGAQRPCLPAPRGAAQGVPAAAGTRWASASIRHDAHPPPAPTPVRARPPTPLNMRPKNFETLNQFVTYVTLRHIASLIPCHCDTSPLSRQALDEGPSASAGQ